MSEVNKRGEYVWWRSFEGKHHLKKEEAAGTFKWIDSIVQSSNHQHNPDTDDTSDRDLISRGIAHPGLSTANENLSTISYYEIMQGSVEVIPAELGLGEQTTPQKWVFAIGNRNQIIQAEPLDLDHDMHPVVVNEPYTLGYGFGQPGMADYLNPIQDLLSWFVNSHMDNVKTALNNMFVVDPSMVEIQDMKKPGAGKIIRLKKAAYGQDVRQALSQLPVTDITTGHIKDFETIIRVGDGLSSVTDNVRGLQSSGGRKTATEIRTSGEAAASRLAANARLISAQALVDLAEQMSMNTQQNMSQEFYLQLVGRDGLTTPVHITPEHITGDFHYPVHDGTLPIDRVAMLDVWKEIFLGIAQDPEMRQQYNMLAIFEHMAELGGAKNLKQFRVDVSTAPDEEVNQQVQAGNLVPTSEVGNLPGANPNIQAGQGTGAPQGVA
jgi:hypothetical protein